MVYKMLTDSDSGDSPLSHHGHLLLQDDPMVWIRKNPTRLLSVRRLELNYSGCSGDRIIGDSIGKLTELTHLSIKYVKTIPCLPNIFSTLRNLQMLHLEDCPKLQELTPNLGDLESLTSLSLFRCTSIKFLPDSSAKLSKLTDLEISLCYDLEELPANFGELESLTHFTLLSCESIKSLPSSFAKLTKLTTLNIEGCDDLEELPANFGELESLTHFTLRYCCSIKSLPRSVAKLTKLTTLNMEGCDFLEALPPNLGDSESLTSLSISFGPSIKFLPDSLAKSSKLTNLEISLCRGLEELPSNFDELESLTHFTLHNCRSIKSLPSSVAKLTKLTTLKIHGCDDLEELPANFGELSLTHFTLDDCSSIKSLIDSVAKLSKLTTLNIRSCVNLQDLSSNSNVVVLSLIECCSIQSLPRGLFNLKQLNLSFCGRPRQDMLANLKYLLCLRHLKFQECPCRRSDVRELPGYLGKLPQLSVLDIQDTRIKCLPNNITELSKLRLLLLPSRFILETLSYQLDESLVISVKDTHVRKTWKELKKEMEIFSSPTVRVDPSGFLPLTGDPIPWCLEHFAPHSVVRILDLQYLNSAAVNIEDSMAELRELAHLCITGGSLTRLPLQLPRITHLSLYDCKFDMESSLDSPGKLSTLEFLRIGLCDSELLHQIDLPVSLRQLTLCLGKHTAPLPDSMTKLSNLKALHLFGEHNRFGEVTQFDSLPEILNLERLKLVDCNIKSLPRGLRHVEILHGRMWKHSLFQDCVKLENCFNQLVDVETLSVTCHHIKFLPSVAGFHNLQELQLKDCFCIKELPPDLDELENLCTLNVSGTRIKSLPCSISRFPKLQFLILPKCFQPRSLPLMFRNRSIIVTIDDTHENYYKDMGYYDVDHETSSEVDDHTTNITEGVNKMVPKESEENINSQQQISPHQLLNQLVPTLVLGDSHGSEANHAIGENSNNTFLSNQNQETEILRYMMEHLTADNRLSNSQNPCFSSSQHALHPEHMASITSETEYGLPPNLQHDFSSGTGNNLVISENGQNEDNVHREGFDSNGRNDLIGENSHIAISRSQNQEMKILFSGVCDDMITDVSSDLHNAVSFDKNSQHAVRDGQMDIRNSGTEHEYTSLTQGISPCNERDVSCNRNNRNASENKRVENFSKSEKGKRQRREITLEDIQSLIAKGMTQIDAGIELGASRSTMKRRCRELGIEKWPSSRHHCTNKKNVSTKTPSKSANGHEHVLGCLDDENQHVLSKYVPSMYDAIDNSTPNATTKSVRESTAPEGMNGTHLCTSSTIVQPNGSSSTFVVKAIYNEDIVRFDFSLSSNINQLKEEISKKLELEVGKFKMKYQDDDGDWVLVTCISDMENALRLSKSAGSDVVRLSVTSKT